MSPTKQARGDSGKERKPIGDRMEKKTWEKPGSIGGPVPLWPDESVVCSNCSKVRVQVVHWFQGSFPDGCLGDEVLTGDLSLGLIYVS